jgi:hypothetical protein
MRLQLFLIMTASAVLAATASAQVPAAPAGGPATAPPTGSAPTVSPLTVSPVVPGAGRVVASTDAAPLTSPDFTAKDAEAPPLAVMIAPNTALGRQSSPPSSAAGLMGANPDLRPPTTDLGVTVVF